MHIIRAGSDRPPLLVTHGLQCDVTFAAMLARVLPEDWPIYAFQAPGLDGREPPLSTIGDMAQRYCDEFDVVGHDSDIVLVGFCAGGHIALEMAHRLIEKGRPIRHLFLIDAPRAMPTGHFDRLADQQVEIAARRLIVRPELSRYFGGGAVTVRAYTDALNRQVNRPYDGSATIVATEESRAMIMDGSLGWSGVLDPQTRILISAPSRQKMLSEGLPDVASIILAVLA